MGIVWNKEMAGQAFFLLPVRQQMPNWNSALQSHILSDTITKYISDFSGLEADYCKHPRDFTI